MKSTFKKSLVVAMLCAGQAMAQQTIDRTLTINSNGVNSTEILMKKQDNTSYYNLFSNYSGFGFYNSTTNNYLLYADASDRVGIGTNAPASNFQVKGKSGFDASTQFFLTNNATAFGRTHLVLTGRFEDGNDSWLFGTGARNAIVFSQNLGGAIGDYGDEKFSLQLEGNSNSLGFLSKSQNSIPVLAMTQGGNVGIGTPTPQEKLSVNGKIRAKEIKVETANWPDYVFEESYQNQSLAEIEQFIKQNKHLPGVPTAKQVEQEGVELGEMNKVLLKKIEELTLLLIEKDKELTKEKEENKQQNKRLYEIEKWIKNKN